MTNFEKWKQELTEEKASKILNDHIFLSRCTHANWCEDCPASINGAKRSCKERQTSTKILNTSPCRGIINAWFIMKEAE